MFGKVKSGSAKSQLQKTESITQKINVPADERLQNKIIAYFANGQNLKALPEGDVSVTPEQTQRVTTQLRNGTITPAEIEKFLLQVMLPMQTNQSSAGQILQQISTNAMQKQILAVATGHNANNWQNVNEADLKNLLAKPTRGQLDYRTPVGFATFRAKFIDGITSQANPDQLAAYETAMDELEQKIYGRRFDYYQQIQLLAHDNQSATAPQSAPAEQSANPTQSTSSAQSTTTPQSDQSPQSTTTVQSENDHFSDDLFLQEIIAEETAAATAPPVTPEPEVIPTAQPIMPTSASLTMLTPERSSDIMNHAIIVGDAWRQDGNDYHLSISNLISGNLIPTYEFSLEGRNIALSDTFQLSDGRGAIIAYINSNDGIRVRSMYLNARTGIWQFAPDIIRGARGEGMSQIGEGYDAASTILPVLLQQKISEIANAKSFREITNVNGDFLFAGNTMAYNTQQEYREALSRNQMRSDFYKEVDTQPITSNWQQVGKNKNSPQLISVNFNLAPNFQAPVARFTSYSTYAGQITLESFYSNDNQWIWVFGSDDWGRVWLANIEVVSPITSTGCRRDWMQAGDLATPLYENSSRAANYGDPSDTRKGLVGMWNQYLSKIPILQEYIAARSQNRG